MESEESELTSITRSKGKSVKQAGRPMTRLCPPLASSTFLRFILTASFWGGVSDYSKRAWLRRTPSSLSIFLEAFLASVPCGTESLDESWSVRGVQVMGNGVSGGLRHHGESHWLVNPWGRHATSRRAYSSDGVTVWAQWGFVGMEATISPTNCHI